MPGTHQIQDHQIRRRDAEARHHLAAGGKSIDRVSGLSQVVFDQRRNIGSSSTTSTCIRVSLDADCHAIQRDERGAVERRAQIGG